ncbi:MAG TPA: DUF1800 domain-containing protein [Falsiroseomonas sp.]|jgi:uncharacterized protein (DUF1800 family)|nr:DUF1800 domain-containing protein [Falsiroseomonas sp.]
MTTRRHIAPIRFGLGLRLGEAPPADPEAWLAAQLAGPGTPPSGGASTADAIRARTAAIAMRRQRDRAQAAQPGGGMEAAPPAGMAAAQPGRGPLAELLRSEVQLWAARRLESPEPFRDRLVDFWSNHFTVSRRSGAVGALPGPLEREAIRPHVTGRFADMLVAVTRHPAMLVYLDNHVSLGPNSEIGRRTRRGLNENLAREVLELHTLSPAGGYTQGDVQQLARILTGWMVAMEREPFGFIWRQAAHEPGPKSLLGRRFADGPDSQEAALRFLANHPATHRHLAVKLARHFVADDPPPAAIRTLEEVLRRTDGDLGAVAKALITLPAAWEPPLGKFRSPQDFVLAATRAAGVERPDFVVPALAALGQTVWSAPQPNGWPDKAGDWAGPEAMMRRVDWAYTFCGRLGRADPGAVTEAALGPFARAETVSAMRGAGSVRDALTLLFASPEFMRR